MTCPTCSGDGKQPCPLCKGKGLETCGRCQGVGYAYGADGLSDRCISCAGKGEISCRRCQGKGTLGGVCSQCGGSGSVSCTCGGSGKTTCPECKGTGEKVWKPGCGIGCLVLFVLFIIGALFNPERKGVSEGPDAQVNDIRTEHPTSEETSDKSVDSSGSGDAVEGSDVHSAKPKPTPVILPLGTQAELLQILDSYGQSIADAEKEPTSVRRQVATEKAVARAEELLGRKRFPLTFTVTDVKIADEGRTTISVKESSWSNPASYGIFDGELRVRMSRSRAAAIELGDQVILCGRFRLSRHYGDGSIAIQYRGYSFYVSNTNRSIEIRSARQEGQPRSERQEVEPRPDEPNRPGPSEGSSDAAPGIDREAELELYKKNIDIKLTTEAYEVVPGTTAISVVGTVKNTGDKRVTYLKIAVYLKDGAGRVIVEEPITPLKQFLMPGQTISIRSRLTNAATNWDGGNRAFRITGIAIE